VTDRSATASAPGRASPGDWWRHGIVYEIFPLTFQDGSGDGVGDLAGITRRLDYLVSLGIAAIWLTPIHPSPLVDFGYDVADYLDVHPVFGTLADFDRFLAEAHRRGLRVILDFVPNHTSDRHPWFVESRASRENPKREWYIWRDPGPNGGPPNNWMSHFGPAWTNDAATGQSYFHQFRAEQPELNYHNPAVLEAMQGVLRFWLDRGVDGFRVDVIALLAKDPELRDEPPNPRFRPGDQLWHTNLHSGTEDLPGVHDIIRAFRTVLDEYDERVMIGELDPIPSLMRYYGETLDEVHLPFNFNLVNGLDWTAPAVREAVGAYDAAIPKGAWPNWVIGNHDRRRVAERIGSAQARVATMLVLTLRGTPFWYYGDELGMLHADVPRERARDGVGMPYAVWTERFSRDPYHAPMSWDRSPHAGFCPPEAEPYLPLARDWQRRNVEVERRDQRSMLSLFLRLTELRKAHAALTHGGYRALDGTGDAVFAYVREAGSDRLAVALNFTAEPTTVDLISAAGTGQVLASTLMDRSGAEPLGSLALRADEGVIVELEA
jgi:alpha-glucosidase